MVIGKVNFKTEENIRYFKLPFIGNFSKSTENQLHKLTKQFCKEGTKIKIVFSIFKLAFLFSTKDKLRYGLTSYVICTFLCVGCNDSHTFLPGLIRKLIKILKFADTSLKTCNANQFVMRTVFQF